MKIFVGIIKYSALLFFVSIVGLTIGAYLNLPVPSKPLVVKTGSMTPSIPAGSLVLVSKNSNDGAGVNYVEGEVITFKSGNDLVSHRIVSVIRENNVKYFQTKGDANSSADINLVAEKDVVGKVSLHAPYIGKFVDFVKTPLGFVLLVTIPVFFIILSELFVILEEIRKSKENKKIRPNFLKPITLTAIAFIFIGSSGAFFSDVATSAGNTLVTSNDFSNLKINEFVASIGGSFTTEWVEIYNAGPVSVDLTDWTIQDANPSSRSLTSLGTINPGSFVVLDITSGFLNNAGDTVSLVDPSSNVRDQHIYTTSSAGVSIGRDNDGSGIFKTCTTATKGTSNNGSC